MNEKYSEMLSLLARVDFPSVYFQFFDTESKALLDEKIEVLTALKNNTPIDDIPKFYDVLELLPPDDTELWD